MHCAPIYGATLENQTFWRGGSLTDACKEESQEEEVSFSHFLLSRGPLHPSGPFFMYTVHVRQLEGEKVPLTT